MHHLHASLRYEVFQANYKYSCQINLQKYCSFCCDSQATQQEPIIFRSLSETDVPVLHILLKYNFSPSLSFVKLHNIMLLIIYRYTIYECLSTGISYSVFASYIKVYENCWYLYIKKTQQTIWVFGTGILNTFRDFRDLNLYVHINTHKCLLPKRS